MLPKPREKKNQSLKKKRKFLKLKRSWTSQKLKEWSILMTTNRRFLSSLTWHLSTPRNRKTLMMSWKLKWRPKRALLNSILPTEPAPSPKIWSSEARVGETHRGPEAIPKERRANRYPSSKEEAPPGAQIKVPKIKNLARIPNAPKIRLQTPKEKFQRHQSTHTAHDISSICSKSPTIEIAPRKRSSWKRGSSPCRRGKKLAMQLPYRTNLQISWSDLLSEATASVNSIHLVQKPSDPQERGTKNPKRALW